MGAGHPYLSYDPDFALPELTANIQSFSGSGYSDPITANKNYYIYEDQLLSGVINVQNYTYDYGRAPESSLKLYQDDTLLWETTTPILSSWGNTNINFSDISFIGSFGEFTLKVVIDEEDAIPEVNNNNNINLDWDIIWIQNSVIDNYPWPIPSGNVEWINGVVNEYRIDKRIHQGVDIKALGGSNVMSVSSGRIIDMRNDLNQYNFITLKNQDGINDGTGFRYYHLNPSTSFNPINNPDKWVVQHGQILGSVYSGTGWGAHIHFDDYTKYGIEFYAGQPAFSANPLRSDGLSPTWNSDTMNPEILDNLVTLVSGVNDPGTYINTHIPFDGNIDFVIFARDKISIPGGGYNRAGLATIKFRILDITGNQVYPQDAPSYDLRVNLIGDRVFHQENDNYPNFVTSNVVPYLYCYSDCGDQDSPADPYYNQAGVPTYYQYVRYYITNNISNPQGSFAGDFNAERDGIPQRDPYVLEVIVEDFFGRSDTETFDIEFDFTPAIERY